MTIEFNLCGNELQLTTAAIGLVIAIVSENPTEHLQLPFLLGQLNVSSHVPLTGPSCALGRLHPNSRK